MSVPATEWTLGRSTCEDWPDAVDTNNLNVGNRLSPRQLIDPIHVITLSTPSIQLISSEVSNEASSD